MKETSENVASQPYQSAQRAKQTLAYLTMITAMFALNAAALKLLNIQLFFLTSVVFFNPIVVPIVIGTACFLVFAVCLVAYWAIYKSKKPAAISALLGNSFLIAAIFTAPFIFGLPVWATGSLIAIAVIVLVGLTIQLFRRDSSTPFNATVTSGSGQISTNFSTSDPSPNLVSKTVGMAVVSQNTAAPDHQQTDQHQVKQEKTEAKQASVPIEETANPSITPQGRWEAFERKNPGIVIIKDMKSLADGLGAPLTGREKGADLKIKLGLSKHANEAHVKNAWKLLNLLCHPDMRRFDLSYTDQHEQNLNAIRDKLINMFALGTDSQETSEIRGQAPKQEQKQKPIIIEREWWKSFATNAPTSNSTHEQMSDEAADFLARQQAKWEAFASKNPESVLDRNIASVMKGLATLTDKDSKTEENLKKKLGLSEKASLEDVNSAWKILSLLCHPDKRGVGLPYTDEHVKNLNNIRDKLADPSSIDSKQETHSTWGYMSYQDQDPVEKFIQYLSYVHYFKFQKKDESEAQLPAEQVAAFIQDIKEGKKNSVMDYLVKNLKEKTPVQINQLREMPGSKGCDTFLGLAVQHGQYRILQLFIEYELTCFPENRGKIIALLRKLIDVVYVTNSGEFCSFLCFAIEKFNGKDEDEKEIINELLLERIILNGSSHEKIKNMNLIFSGLNKNFHVGTIVDFNALLVSAINISDKVITKYLLDHVPKFGIRLSVPDDFLAKQKAQDNECAYLVDRATKIYGKYTYDLHRFEWEVGYAQLEEINAICQEINRSSFSFFGNSKVESKAVKSLLEPYRNPAEEKLLLTSSQPATQNKELRLTTFQVNPGELKNIRRIDLYDRVQGMYSKGQISKDVFTRVQQTVMSQVRSQFVHSFDPFVKLSSTLLIEANASSDQGKQVVLRTGGSGQLTKR